MVLSDNISDVSGGGGGGLGGTTPPFQKMASIQIHSGVASPPPPHPVLLNLDLPPEHLSNTLKLCHIQYVHEQ